MQALKRVFEAPSDQGTDVLICNRTSSIPMDPRPFAIMGAGEVRRFLARGLSSEGHAVTVVDHDHQKQAAIEEHLDVGFVLGSGSHVPTLEAAGVGNCDLFVAASSSDDANLTASCSPRLSAHHEP